MNESHDWSVWKQNMPQLDDLSMINNKSKHETYSIILLSMFLLKNPVVYLTKFQTSGIAKMLETKGIKQ